MFVDHDGRLFQGIHGYTTNLPDGGKGKDVREGPFVVPHRAETRKVSDHMGVLKAAVTVHAQTLFGITMADVSQELLVGEDVYGRLNVEQDPVLINHVFLGDDNGIVVLMKGKIYVVVIIVIIIITVIVVIFFIVDIALE